MTVKECKRDLNEVKRLLNKVMPDKRKNVFERIDQMERVFESKLFVEYKRLREIGKFDKASFLIDNLSDECKEYFNKCYMFEIELMTFLYV